MSLAALQRKAAKRPKKTPMVTNAEKVKNSNEPVLEKSQIIQEIHDNFFNESVNKNGIENNVYSNKTFSSFTKDCVLNVDDDGKKTESQAVRFHNFLSL